MMTPTPQEKANELFNLMYGKTPTRKSKHLIKQDKEIAKQCALIAVKQMQLVMSSFWKVAGIDEQHRSVYLEEVKKEIEKL